jgi:hypothetical protein
MNPGVHQNAGEILFHSAINKSVERLDLQSLNANSESASLLNHFGKPVTDNGSIDAGNMLALFRMEKHQRLQFVAVV